MDGEVKQATRTMGTTLSKTKSGDELTDLKIAKVSGSLAEEDITIKLNEEASLSLDNVNITVEGD